LRVAALHCRLSTQPYGKAEMKASELVEIMCAAHLGNMVESPFKERGGLMLVGPPGVLKTTFVSVLDTQYQDVVMMSDINVKSLIRFRDAIASGKINTLVLPELAKIYERLDATAKNVEGTLRALTAEGFSAASFEDSRINRLTARAMVIGALTPSVLDKHFTEWEESGFNRRFLWLLIKLADPNALERAAINWQRIEFRQAYVPMSPMGETIPNLTTHRERQRLANIVKYQPGGDHAIQLQVMVRILAVLRWWYTEAGFSRNAMETMEKFAPALGKNGIALELPTSKDAVDDAREHQMEMTNAARILASGRKTGKQFAVTNGRRKK
jgi:hypothetical protein